MNRNQTIIAILNNAIDHLWNGVERIRYVGNDNPYRQTPEYMCHAVEFAISEVVKGDRNINSHIASDEFGAELQDKIMDAIPGYSTADGYCRSRGILADDEVQAFRKTTLQAILAHYEEVEAKTVKPSVLVRRAIQDHLSNGANAYTTKPCSYFTCIAVSDAVAAYANEGVDATEVEKEVKERIAEVLGVPLDSLHISSYDSVLRRTLGSDFVRSQGTEWVQARRREMLERIATRLEKEGK